MIDEKKIEEAAKEYAAKRPPIINCGARMGFTAGINWFLDNLWHIADEEEPKPTPKYKYGYISEDEIIWLLAITKDNEIRMMYSTHEVEYEGDEAGYWLFHDTEGDEYNPFHGEVKKWLYIDDLLKGGNNG